MPGDTAGVRRAGTSAHEKVRDREPISLDTDNSGAVKTSSPVTITVKKKR